MNPVDVAAALDRLHALALSLGVTDDELAEIMRQVHEEAQASPMWGRFDERLSEIRSRLMRAAVGGSGSK